MKPVVWMTLIAIPLLLVGVLFWALNSTSYSAMPETPLLMQTATCCPRVTQEPFWVEPVTSPTDLLSQDVRVYLGNCRGVTVTVETGTLAATYRGGCLPHSVNITLWPNTTYHLKVVGEVPDFWGCGCFYKGYTLIATRDKFWNPLIITQVFTVTSTSFLPLILMDDCPPAADGVMTDLGTLGGVHSRANGINYRGQVVGRSHTADGYSHAFLWEDGVMTDLGTLGWDVSAAAGINNCGQVAGWSETTHGYPHAFLWEDGLMTDLGTLGGTNSSALGINNCGQVAGWSETTDGYPHAFLWTE